LEEALDLSFDRLLMMMMMMILCVNIITITNYLVQHISACMGHCHLTVKCNEVFGCLLKLKFQLLHMWCL
jgi:hypothetical protein